MNKKNILNIQSYQLKFGIATMAQILNVHKRTLRIYDKENILKPNRTQANRRYYTIDDVKKGKTVLFLTNNLGMNLAGVKIILNLLEIMQIKESEKLKYIIKSAEKTNIDDKKQKENIEKFSKRGRPSSK